MTKINKPNGNGQKKINKFLLYSLIMGGLVVLVNILFATILLNINKFSNLAKNMFILVNLAVLIVLLLINVGLLLITRSKKYLYKNIFIGFLCILMILGGFGTYLVLTVNNSIGNIIDTGDTVEETREVAFVVYDNSSINSTSDLANKKFGIIDNENFMEGNILALKELSNLNLTVSYVYYDSYSAMLLGLFNGEIDVAALPSNYSDVFGTDENMEEHLALTKVIHQFSEKVTLTNDNTNQVDVLTEPFSILIMGNDGGRTDALMVATVNPTNLTITLTSIARDSYVPIACYSGNAKDKIAHARMVSRQCTIDTVENLLDIEINFYVEVNFKGVVAIVDAIGKIPIDSPVEFVGQTSSDNRGTYTVWVPAGLNYLNGEQVLAFARERKHMPGGDFQRQQNQQQVISSLISSVLNMRSIDKAVAVFNAAGDNISTNMSLNQMIDLLSLGISKMNSSYVNNANLFNIYGSRVTGYDSNTYDEGMGLVLWIYKPYQGAINDAHDFINRNLRINVEPKIPDTFSYDVTWGWNGPVFNQETYNEAEIHDPIPEIVPNMVSGAWTLEQAQAWANARGISLVVNEIKPGSGSYNANYAQNQIIAQSVAAGKLVEKTSSITIDVIKHQDVDIEVTDFTGKNSSEAKAWANTNGLVYSEVLVPTTNTSLIGTIQKTSPAVGSTIKKGATFTVYVYGESKSVSIAANAYVNREFAGVKSELEGLGLVVNQVNTNVETEDTSLIGKVIITSHQSGSLAQGSNIQVKTTTYVKKEVTPPVMVNIPNYVGQLINNVPSSYQGITIVQVAVDTSTGTDKQVFEQSHTGEVAEGTVVTVKFYNYVAPEPEPEPEPEPAPSGGEEG